MGCSEILNRCNAHIQNQKRTMNSKIRRKSLPGSLKTIQCRLAQLCGCAQSPTQNEASKLRHEQKTWSQPNQFFTSSFLIATMPKWHNKNGHSWHCFRIHCHTSDAHQIMFQALKTHHYETWQIDFQSIRFACVSSWNATSTTTSIWQTYCSTGNRCRKTYKHVAEFLYGAFFRRNANMRGIDWWWCFLDFALPCESFFVVKGKTIVGGSASKMSHHTRIFQK